MGADSLRVVFESGDEDVARVYVGVLRGDDRYKVEFVESLQPPKTRAEKQVIIVSSMFGCPVQCTMCDAGGSYAGKMTAEEILAQSDHVIDALFPGRRIDTSMLKVQFARVGEPTMNPAVLEAVRGLKTRYDTENVVPCVSTIAPKGCLGFLESLRGIKDELYPGGRFQLQFSVHTTDWRKRRELIPIETLSMEEISEFGESWWHPGDRKVTLNFAPAQGYPVDARKVAERFDPSKFIIKLTPVNPTFAKDAHRLESVIDPHRPDTAESLRDQFQDRGFDVIVSIGEVAENRIGSNCGMYLASMDENRYQSS